MPPTSEDQSGKNIVKAPSVEFLLKQVYFAHREKVKTLEAEIQQLKIGRSLKCTECKDLKLTLEQFKKEHETVVQNQNQKIETLEHQLSIALTRAPDESIHAKSTCFTKNCTLARSPLASVKVKDDSFSENIVKPLQRKSSPQKSDESKREVPGNCVQSTLDTLSQKVCSEEKQNIYSPEVCKSDSEDFHNVDHVILVPETVDDANWDFELVSHCGMNNEKNEPLDNSEEKWKKVQIKKVENWLNGCDIPETNCEKYSELQVLKDAKMEFEENKTTFNEKNYAVNINQAVEKSEENQKHCFLQPIKNEPCSGSGFKTVYKVEEKKKTSKPDLTLESKQMLSGSKFEFTEHEQNKYARVKLMKENKFGSMDGWQKSPSLLGEVPRTRSTLNSTKSISAIKSEQGLGEEADSHIFKSNKFNCKQESVNSKEKSSRSIVSSGKLANRSETETIASCTKRLRQSKLSTKKWPRSKKSKRQTDSVSKPVNDNNALSDEVFDSPDSFRFHKIAKEELCTGINHLQGDDNQLEDSKLDETFLPPDFSYQFTHATQVSQVDDNQVEHIVKMTNKENIEDFSDQSSDDLLLELQQASPKVERKSHDIHKTGRVSAVLEENQIDSFDIVPQPPKPVFKYKEDTVRNKEARKQLAGHDCKMCEKYYRELGLSESALQERLKLCSRHRATNVPPPTPEHYWDLDFPDTEECKARGYLNETQKVHLKKSSRRQPLY